MTKRKFVEDNEDAQDQDYQDSQDSGDEYVPSSHEDDNERQSSRTLRATQSRSRNTASGPQNRANEEGQGDGEGQGEISESGVDTPTKSNTLAAPHQNAADVPQVRFEKQHPSPDASSYYVTGFLASH